MSGAHSDGITTCVVCDDRLTGSAPLRASNRFSAGLLCLLGLVACFLTGFGPPRLVDRPYGAAQKATVGELRGRYLAQTPPAVSARSYLVYDLDAERLLLAGEAEMPRAPASLTKLMTALLILEQDELTRTVTILGSDRSGEATMGLAAGERLTVEELLWGLLVPSGNDAALALARTAAGSVEEFVGQMNSRADELSLQQTHFVNPHGLDAEQQTSSALDLLVVTRQLWRYPLFQEIVATNEITVAGHHLRNTNELLPTFPGTVGVKTGTSAAAGQCLIAAIQRDGRRVLLIVLGSRDRYSDVRALYRHYASTYQWLTPSATELALLNRLYAPDGARWYLRPIGAVPARLGRPWEAAQIRAYRRLILPPAGVAWRSGLEVGVVEWRLDGVMVGVQTLVLW